MSTMTSNSAQPLPAEQAELAAFVDTHPDQDIAAAALATGVAELVSAYGNALAGSFTPKRAEGADCVLQWTVRVPDGDDTAFHLVITDGVATFSPSSHPRPQLTIGYHLSDFVRTVAGRLDETRAYLSGRLSLRGDIGLAEKMETWFAEPTPAPVTIAGAAGSPSDHPGAIVTCAADTPPADIARHLDTHGVCTIEGLLDDDQIEQLLAELGPDLTAATAGGGEFFGHRSKRLASIPARFPSCAVLLTHPTLLAVADQVLAEGCLTYQLQTAAVLEVWPGGTPQPLHRDFDVYAPYLTHQPDAPARLLSIMCALTDFTAANGATRLVPGSHRWEPQRQPIEDQTVQAAMPRGSVTLWLGSTHHGMAVNTTDAPRTGLVFGYVAGWLRQEENHYLAAAPDIAASLPPRLQQLLGYQQHGPLLGWVADRDPDAQLSAGQS
ncbi:hypothetical protein TUM20983_37360 [Mycobacterium antarcticum]|uniref:phytanoyl-CoA dioxygenase family protein n=1 Tax=Mycolicibacterium sp. TUM20983 TaxID=3023369 RepID=UPI00239F4FEF|nr:phytanoyl-CoA dioxygenase family protein [Mycolicibacterium sp. TUM20983]GLP76626.1 hypothetical protein TUM20983_37360 [Mycolicibacterium sp. TUM20983]